MRCSRPRWSSMALGFYLWALALILMLNLSVLPFPICNYACTSQEVWRETHTKCLEDIKHDEHHSTSCLLALSPGVDLFNSVRSSLWMFSLAHRWMVYVQNRTDSGGHRQSVKSGGRRQGRSLSPICMARLLNKLTVRGRLCYSGLSLKKQNYVQVVLQMSMEEANYPCLSAVLNNPPEVTFWSLYETTWLEGPAAGYDNFTV